MQHNIHRYRSITARHRRQNGAKRHVCDRECLWPDSPDLMHNGCPTLAPESDRVLFFSIRLREDNFRSNEKSPTRDGVTLRTLVIHCGFVHSTLHVLLLLLSWLQAARRSRQRCRRTGGLARGFVVNFTFIFIAIAAPKKKQTGGHYGSKEKRKRKLFLGLLVLSWHTVGHLITI